MVPVSIIDSFNTLYDSKIKQIVFEIIINRNGFGHTRFPPDNNGLSKRFSEN